jgi:hypothetical protein
MTAELIRSTKDRDGRDRFYILPVESPAAFEDLLKFVLNDCRMRLDQRIDGPDSTSCRLAGADGVVLLVLGDMTGAQIIGERLEDGPASKRIALEVAARLRQVLVREK